MSAVNNTNYSIVWIIGFLVAGAIIGAILLITKRKKLALISVGVSVLAALIALLIGTISSRKSMKWNSEVSFGIDKTAKAVELVKEAVDDERSSFPENFHLNNSVIQLNGFDLGFVGGSFSTFRFEVVNATDSNGKLYQIGPKDSFFINDSGKITSDKLLPLSIAELMLSSLDDEHWIENRFKVDDSPVHIEYLTKLDKLDKSEMDGKIYMLDSGSIAELEDESVEGTMYLFEITAGAQKALLIVKDTNQ